MGRPLPKKLFTELGLTPSTKDGMQLKLTLAWIPGAPAPTSSAWIVRQKGTHKFIATDGTFTGVVFLQSAESLVVTEGTATIRVTPFGQPAEHARSIQIHRVKTFEGNEYSWNPTVPAAIASESNLPVV